MAMTEDEFEARMKLLREQAESLGVTYCACGHVAHRGRCQAMDYGALPCICEREER